MIRRFLDIVPNPRSFMRLVVLQAVVGVLQGLLLGALVPILRALLRPEPDLAAATPWLVAAGAGVLVYWWLSVRTVTAGFVAAGDTTAQVRHRLMEHLTALPMGWFTADRKGTFVRTATTVAGEVGHVGVVVGGPAVKSLVVALSITAVAMAVDWRIGLVFLATIPVALLAARRCRRITTDVVIDVEAAANEIAGRAVEYGQAQPVLRAAGRARIGTAQMRDALAEHRRRYARGLNRLLIPDQTYTAVVATGFVAALLLVTKFMLTNLPVADAVALLVLAVRFIEPLGALGGHISGIGALDYLIATVDDFLHTPSLPRSPRPVRRVAGGGIEFADVTFGYGATPVLTNVSFVCPAGSTTALVGPSGSGKTTVLRLAARFFDVDSGVVRVGGVDVRDYDHAALLAEIAVVFQDVYLFDTSIEENVRPARPHATRAELDAAARAARLDEVVERLPDGWQTRVGEAGLALSGGERQRVSIARAFLKRARIVLIDEAASALDPENEAAVSAAIAELAADPERTVMVIAHRPATLEAADAVVALEEGRVAETGAPAQLLQSDGIFARLYWQYERARGWHVSAGR
ncbi:MAG TPA: ABC transporter ATP-binding protein [Mycobacterium sp.]|nr:ABC transporter ATP-binding protein [Mycobacterium sp.]